MSTDIDFGSSSDEIQEDSTGGGGRYNVPSGLYKLVIEAAYVTDSKAQGSKSKSLNLIFRTEDGVVIKDRQTIVSRAGQIYTVKDGKQQNLIGYDIANGLAKVAADTPFRTMLETGIEQKSIMMYNYNAGKEVATDVNMVMPLVGKTILGGVVRNIVPTREQVGGEWVDSKQYSKYENVVTRFFNVDTKKTANEMAKDLPAEFCDRWVVASTGKDNDKTNGIGYNPKPRANAAPAADNNTADNAASGGSAEETESLF